MRIFVSYSRRAHDQVSTLISEIESLGHTVWSDNGLVAGHIWWEQILEQIRNCEVFLAALSPETQYSSACKQEWLYARGLNKVILPVLVADGVSFDLLHPDLAAVQHVDYRGQDRAAAFALVKAVNNLPAPRPLPDPLPQPPPVPISHLGSIKDEIETAHSLGLEKQSALWVQLKALFAESNGGADVRAVLGMLRRRVDLLATIAAEIDTLLQPTPPAQVVSQRRGQSPIPSATPSSQLPEWRAELISKQTLARTLRVHLTRDTHVIELAIRTTFPAKAVVTLRGESLVESSIPFSSSLATGAHAMKFALPDGDERREAKVDTVFSIWSGRIKRLQLSIDGKRLYDDERAAGT